MRNARSLKIGLKGAGTSEGGGSKYSEFRPRDTSLQFSIYCQMPLYLYQFPYVFDFFVHTDYRGCGSFFHFSAKLCVYSLSVVTNFSYL